MENPTIRENHEKAKREAKIFHDSVGRMWCPASNQYVAFTKAGFRHLMRKGGKRRSLREQTRRFLLLPRAKEIIADPTVEIVHNKGKTANPIKSHGAKVPAKPDADFWTLTKTCGDLEITVVIRQIGTKPKHFFSIYDAKPKHQKTAI